MSSLLVTRSFRPVGDRRSAVGVATRRARAALLARLGRTPTETEALLIERAASLQVNLMALHKRIADGADGAAADDEFIRGAARLAELLALLGVNSKAKEQSS